MYESLPMLFLNVGAVAVDVAAGQSMHANVGMQDIILSSRWVQASQVIDS